jgi:microcystin-dependent protein
MPDLSTASWSETDASNSQPPPNGWLEGQPPSTVNDCARMMMGALKRWWNRDHASAGVTVGGTANAITLSYAAGPTAYVQGEKFAFIATGNNSGATTVNINGLGAKSLYKQGLTGPITMVGGEIKTGQLVEIEYDGTQFQLISPVAGSGDQTVFLPSGVVAPFAGSSAPAGWLLCDGSAVSRTIYAALFAAIGTTWGAGDGSTTFNVPNMLGRVPVGAGLAGSYAQTVGSAAITTASSQITIAANDEIKTGTPLVYTTSGTAIGGLTPSNTYYAIIVDSTHIKLASSLANAVAGSAISLTTQGTGNHTFTKNLTARTLGASGGEEAHALTIAEMPSHNHPLAGSGTANPGDIYSGGQTNVGSVNPTGLTGGSGSHNNMPPYAGVIYIVKT